MPLKLIKPEIFSDSKNIKAVFTTANKKILNANSLIPGLNLGNNTGAEPHMIDQNIDRLFGELGWNRSDVASAIQVHHNSVVIVDEPGIYPNCDGLITNKKGIILSIQVADCAAVLIANPAKQSIGAFHAGWKGAAKGIVTKGLKLMKKIDNNEGYYKVFISPCISLQNFEVGEEVAEKFPENVVDRQSFSKPHVDLKSFLVTELEKVGVEKTNIQVSGVCTFENSEFYSFRREREKAGRMLALIKLNQL